jgi:hypothetical protein
MRDTTNAINAINANNAINAINANNAKDPSHVTALDRSYVDDEKFEEIYSQADKTAKIISGLIKYLCTRPPKPTK